MVGTHGDSGILIFDACHCRVFYFCCSFFLFRSKNRRFILSLIVYCVDLRLWCAHPHTRTRTHTRETAELVARHDATCSGPCMLCCFFFVLFFWEICFVIIIIVYLSIDRELSLFFFQNKYSLTNLPNQPKHGRAKCRIT